MKQTTRRLCAFVFGLAVTLAFALYSPSPPGYGKQGYGQIHTTAYHLDTSSAAIPAPAAKLDLAALGAEVGTSYPAPHLRAAATELDGLLNSTDKHMLLTVRPPPLPERLRRDLAEHMYMNVDTTNVGHTGKHLGLGAGHLVGRSPTSPRLSLDTALT